MDIKKANAQIFPTRDSMTEYEFNTMIEKGDEEAKSNNGLSIEEAFSKINKGIK